MPPTPKGGKPAHVRFFKSPAALRTWFAKHHDTATELQVGYHKKHTGTPSITWQESVDEALCVGWIDGVRHALDDATYTIRFTPRRPGSTWSAINIRRVAALEAEGRMRPAGRRAFEARTTAKSGIYAYENRPADLPEPYAGAFRRHAKAWAFFESLPAGYRRTLTWWIVSAKQDATRDARLRKLIDASARGVRL
jgi:uncharacterized protein YdeI (YjbR/CyaY-like superfamily)